MGKSIPVTLGRSTFPTKQAARVALRDVRNRYGGGGPILCEDDVDLLLGVVAAHPQAAEKVGAGIAGFYVARSPDHPTFCFYLRRVDGSFTDFSWNEALTPTDAFTRLRMACRNAVQDEKIAFRNACWPPEDTDLRTCPITGKQFGRPEAQVDHEPPRTLKALVADWLVSSGLTLDGVPVVHTGDLRSEDSFGLDEHLHDWRAFHARAAKLRIVSAEGNLIQGARQLGP